MCALIELFVPELVLACTVSCQPDYIRTLVWSELIHTHFNIYLCLRNCKLRTSLHYWDNNYYCNFFTTVHLMSIITRAHNGSFSGHFPLCRARCPGPKFATENKSVAWQWSIWSNHITIIMETNNGPGTGARARPGHVHESGQFNYLILWIEELSQYLNHH